MKSRNQVFVSIAFLFLILGVTIFTFGAQKHQPGRDIPAMITRDCALWDVSAFRVSIPMSTGTFVDISIWKTPNIKVPVTFSFSDYSGQTGNANYRSASDEYGQLSGTVFFWHVEEENQVMGSLDLAAEDGRRFEGQFEFDWEDQIIFVDE